MKYFDEKRISEDSVTHACLWWLILIYLCLSIVSIPEAAEWMNSFEVVATKWVQTLRLTVTWAVMFWLETAPTTSRPSPSTLTTSTDTSLKSMAVTPGEDTSRGWLSFRSSSSCHLLLWRSVWCQLVERIRDFQMLSTQPARDYIQTFSIWQGKVSKSLCTIEIKLFIL